jgi:hypothetical protein
MRPLKKHFEYCGKIELNIYSRLDYKKQKLIYYSQDHFLMIMIDVII